MVQTVFLPHYTSAEEFLNDKSVLQAHYREHHQILLETIQQPLSIHLSMPSDFRGAVEINSASQENKNDILAPSERWQYCLVVLSELPSM